MQTERQGAKMEKKEKTPRGFYVQKGSFMAHAAVTVLVISIAARLLGTMNLWGEMPLWLIEVALPIGCAVLFILFILLLGRVALWTTILPVLGGATFFVLSNFDQVPGWPLFICIALAFLSAFVYTATLSGLIRTKWLIALVFAGILAYMVIYRAIPVFGDMQNPVSFADGMKLLSSIGFVFAMFCATLAMRRRKPAKVDAELPKIKDPKVVPPQEEMPPAEEPAAPETAVESVETVENADTRAPLEEAFAVETENLALAEEKEAAPGGGSFRTGQLT